jgi:hypothetical protein
MDVNLHKNKEIKGNCTMKKGEKCCESNNKPIAYEGLK